MCLRSFAALLVTLGLSLSTSAATVARTEADLRAAEAPIRARLREIESLRESSPARYIDAVVAAAEELAKVADEFKDVSQSAGVRMDAISRLMMSADFARLRLHDPRRSIALYRRAAALHAVTYPASKGLAMNEQIADVYEYDLGDDRAAASALRAIQHLRTTPTEGRRDDQLWAQWYEHWLDAEITFLENGREYSGEISSADLSGFSQMLLFGAARETTNGDPLGPQLDIYSLPAALSAETAEKVLHLPASHSMFLKTWMFASRLTKPEDARQWLMRNDRAGFWRACLLALAAVSDRLPQGSQADNLLTMLARTPGRTVTGFALLSREYAKNHVIPSMVK